MKVEVTKYRKPDGYLTRYWSVMVDGELLAVTLYRKGAVAVARAITNSNQDPHVTTLQDSSESRTSPRKLSAGVATYLSR
jgi:6-phosphogluconolactonase (cycloisomerase 2 family)